VLQNKGLGLGHVKTGSSAEDTEAGMGSNEEAKEKEEDFERG
jgi:hypothetical protein